MIDISSKLSQPIIDWFIDGFLQRLKYRLLKSSQPVELEFNFEKKFYRSLYCNAQFARDFINMSPLDMEKFNETSAFKNHRLFFLLCLPLSIRQNRSFLKHYQKEMKNLPSEMMHQNLQDVAFRVRGRAVNLFDYGKFGTKPTRKVADLTIWNAYSFLHQIRPKVCPFCNVSITPLLVEDVDHRSGELRSRPALDHYLCKSKYPFFGVNIRNLVPSCTTCNSNLKGEQDFMDEPHLNPYHHSILTSHSFNLYFEGDGFLRFISNDGTGNIEEEDFRVGFSMHHHSKRAENSIGTFELELQYNATKSQYIDFVADLPLVNRHFLEQQMEILGLNTIEEAARKYLKLPRSIEDVAHSALKHSLFDTYVRQRIQ